MPRNLTFVVVFTFAVVATGCFFDADYGAGGFRCSDGECPRGLTCDETNHCVSFPRDAGADSLDATEAPLDGDMGVMHAMTCADPGAIPVTGGTASGTTVGRTSTVSAMCGGTIMNGSDAVYSLSTTTSNAPYLIAMSGLKAYVIADCTPTPATPVCIGNLNATTGNPINVTLPTAGDYFIVVDHEVPTTTGPYTLTVTAL